MDISKAFRDTKADENLVVHAKIPDGTEIFLRYLSGGKKDRWMIFTRTNKGITISAVDRNSNMSLPIQLLVANAWQRCTPQVLQRAEEYINDKKFLDAFKAWDTTDR